jgi:hypothetical protein
MAITKESAKYENKIAQELGNFDLSEAENILQNKRAKEQKLNRFRVQKELEFRTKPEFLLPNRLELWRQKWQQILESEEVSHLIISQPETDAYKKLEQSLDNHRDITRKIANLKPRENKSELQQKLRDLELIINDDVQGIKSRFWEQKSNSESPKTETLKEERQQEYKENLKN